MNKKSIKRPNEQKFHTHISTIIKTKFARDCLNLNERAMSAMNSALNLAFNIKLIHCIMIHCVYYTMYIIQNMYYISWILSNWIAVKL